MKHSLATCSSVVTTRSRSFSASPHAYEKTTRRKQSLLRPHSLLRHTLSAPEYLTMASDCAGQDIGEYSPQFTYPPANGQQLRVHNGNTFINNSAVNNRNRSRTTDYDNPPDLDNQFAQIPIYMQPEPLQIRKPSDPIRVAKSSQALNDNNPYNNVSASPIYPPRTSSIYGVTELRDSAGFRAQKKSHRRQPSDDPSVHRSTLSSCKGAYLSGASVDMSPSMDTHSSVSSHHGHSVIIGNFVPLVKATTAASSTMSASKNAVDG